MTHLWVRSEARANEERVGLTPEGVKTLREAGFSVTVEESPHRVLEIEGYRDAGAEIVPEGSWQDAPSDAIIFGLKELPEDGSPLIHRHIMFGHAFKGQPDGKQLLKRFREGGGALYDLEYLVDENGRRLAAFGYWAGYVGAAVALKAWLAQQRGGICAPVQAWPDRAALLGELSDELVEQGARCPATLVIGALGRVGSGASDLIEEMGGMVTKWDMAETAHGGPFPQVLTHPIFVNAILAQPGAPVFVTADAPKDARDLRVIADVACDPTSDFSPIKVYNRATSWDDPVTRVAAAPPLDVMAIDNLPSLLPRESALDYAGQLLPVLQQLDRIGDGPWGRAKSEFERHISAL